MSTTQSRLLGEPDDRSIHIQTSGRTIRPALALPDALVDECKPRFTADGLEARAVDPPNVAMLHLDIHAEAFDSYAVDAHDGFEIRVDLDYLTDTLAKARLGAATDDPVQLDVDATRTIVEIEREYSDTTLRFADEVLSLDPESLREKPEIPELDLPCAATVDVAALSDAVQHIDTHADHAQLRYSGGDLVVSGGANDESPSDAAAAVSFDGVADADCEEPEGVSAIYSLSYLKSIAGALADGKIDQTRVVWGDEFPAKFHFERTDDETTLYEGQFLVAPRIGGED